MTMQQALDEIIGNGWRISLTGEVARYGDRVGQIVYRLTATKGDYGASQEVTVRGEGLTVEAAAADAVSRMEGALSSLRSVAAA